MTKSSGGGGEGIRLEVQTDPFFVPILDPLREDLATIERARLQGKSPHGLALLTGGLNIKHLGEAANTPTVLTVLEEGARAMTGDPYFEWGKLMPGHAIQGILGAVNRDRDGELMFDENALWRDAEGNEIFRGPIAVDRVLYLPDGADHPIMPGSFAMRAALTRPDTLVSGKES